MEFSYAYWKAELVVFRQFFKDDQTCDVALCNCMKGLAYLAENTVREHPEIKAVVMSDFDDAVLIATVRMGLDWVAEQAAIIEDHDIDILPT